ncbi:putative sulfate transporter [Gordonia hirsuta DSM 44140 = NBRC 16056]|uniref:Putative sulfate transporter n=1 Tax=Gordonia hirsuta DSM 44140 = NBRC 16056 TaxID=1121927 RepID=L7LBB9_9ACTN|nr:putative sulfate transporter [Gordonia hirsuta DSM 44140 = NBRC 16056]
MDTAGGGDAGVTPRPRTRRRRFTGELLRWLPAATTVGHYRWGWLRGDLVAGIAVAALMIPAGLGYAEVSGLPPVHGLYATVIPVFVYALIGPSRILVLGPESALAPIIAAAIIPLAVTNMERRVELAGVLAIEVGVILLLAGVFRAGVFDDAAGQTDPHRLPQRDRAGGGAGSGPHPAGLLGFG